MSATQTPAFRVRPAAPADIPALSAIHRSALPGDLLPRLGERFLRRVFLPLALRGDLGFSLVAEVAGSARAFVVYATDPSGFSRALAMEHPLELLRALIGGAVARPLLPLQVMTAARTSSGGGALSPAQGAGLPELYVIATDPAFQSLGLGRALVRRGLAELSARGASGCLVRTASSRAREFYEREGFAVVGREKRGDRILVVLLHGLTLGRRRGS